MLSCLRTLHSPDHCLNIIFMSTFNLHLIPMSPCPPTSWATCFIIVFKIAMETAKDQNEDMISDLSAVWLYTLFLIVSLLWGELSLIRKHPVVGSTWVWCICEVFNIWDRCVSDLARYVNHFKSKIFFQLNFWKKKKNSVKHSSDGKLCICIYLFSYEHRYLRTWGQVSPNESVTRSICRMSNQASAE